MMRFSRTVSSLSSVSCCGTTPRRPRIRGPSATGAMSRMRSVPAVGGDTQPIIRIVELFPAPFGPRKPNASPRCTSKSIPSTAASSPNFFTSPRAWISGALALMTARLSALLLEARRGALERFRQLRELVLVFECELDSCARHLRAEPGQMLERVTHTGGERRIDGCRTNARLLLRARPFCALLGGTHGQALLHDLPGELAAAVVVGDREHRARMSFGELPAFEHREHVVGEVEQPDRIRDGRLRAADALGDLSEREPELVEQYRVRASFLRRRELLACDVLDQAEQERVAVVGLAHDGRDGLVPRFARGAPAALAGDDLVPARSAGAHEQRLDDALAANGLGKPRAGLTVEALARLLRIRVNRVDRQVEQLRRARLEPADEHLEPAAQAASVTDARQAPSPPSSTHPPRRSCGRRRSPATRGSAPPAGAPNAGTTAR